MTIGEWSHSGMLVKNRAEVTLVAETRVLGDFADGMIGLCSVSYTHLDVYKRQKRSSTDTELQLGYGQRQHSHLTEPSISKSVLIMLSVSSCA